MSEEERLSQYFSAQAGRVRKRIEQYALRVWDSMPDYRDAAVEELIEDLTPRVLAGQETIMELTNGYLDAAVKRMGLDPVSARVDTAAVERGLRGVDPREVYRRPAVTVYTSLSEGAGFDESVAKGRLRLLQIIGGDMQIAKTRQAHNTMSLWSGQKGYPRFYHRTLQGEINCALCVVASTQRYRVDSVMPIHPGCDCGFEPLPAGAYSQVIDDDRLEAAHKAVEDAGFESSRSAREPDYRKILLEGTHGEYGRVLTGLNV